MYTDLVSARSTVVQLSFREHRADELSPAVAIGAGYWVAVKRSEFCYQSAVVLLFLYVLFTANSLLSLATYLSAQ